MSLSILNKRIMELIDLELQNNEHSYAKSLGKPYQAYERIGFEGSRWSVEKRIKEYGLERFFDPESTILDIGSNYGFFVVEFAMHCKAAYGVEPTVELNEVGREVARYFGIEDKVHLFDVSFETFDPGVLFDTVLSLAAFYTADGRERSAAEAYFGKIHDLLKPGGAVFYESTSYHKESDKPNYAHFVKSREALRAIHSIFDSVEDWETPTGHAGDAFRQFAIGRKCR